MAEAEAIVNGGEAHDLGVLLSTTERDFLVRNNGDQVKVSNLHGKILGLYFSASWCGPCRRFTPNLIEAYAEIASKGNAFEVVFISADMDEDAFHEYFSKMPWLAIPFSDSETRECLNKLFKVRGIPHLVVLDGNGKVLSDKAVQIVSDYGSEGYPFTPEKIKKMREDEEAAKRDQTVQSVLVSPSRDYLISNDGNKARVSELEGKIVGLYFSISTFGSCTEFTPKLAEMYRKLKENDESFEVVLVSLDPDESFFEASFASMPWLAIPFKDKSRERLARNFEIRSIPTLLVFDSDGKTRKENVAELVEEHGVEAFPFSTEKLKELEEKEKAKLEAQTLESLLVSGELDYVLGKDGNKVPVLELVGKNVLLYFSAEWCGPCRAFLPKLIEVYHKIKNKDGTAFDIIFISSDRDQNSFDKFYSTMPWLALPFGDERKKSLSRKFKIRGIPSLVVIGTTGRTVTKEARDLLMVHGADAYPFTEERIKELEARIEETAKGWPEKVKHELHEHELVKTHRRSYGCDGCTEMGHGWSFYCAECDFDMHPECALEANKGENGEEVEEGKGEISSEEKEGGYVCDGVVCRKA